MSVFTAGDRTPFTYLIKCIPTGEMYYGVRYAKGCQPIDLWVSYFTSSKKVSDRIQLFGTHNFEFQIRKVFTCSIAARAWEDKVLRRMNVIGNPIWLNNHYGCNYAHRGNKRGHRRIYMVAENRYRLVDSVTAQHFVDKGLAIFQSPERSESAAEATSRKLKGRKKSPEHIQNLAQSLRSSRRNKGAKYTNGIQNILVKEGEAPPAGFVPGSYTKGRKGYSAVKGKTYEEIYGAEKASQLKTEKSIKLQQNNKNWKFKGRTYEEIHGPDKARELREQRSESKFKTYSLYQLDQLLFKGSREEIVDYFLSTYQQKSALYNKEWLAKNNLRLETQYTHRSHCPR